MSGFRWLASFLSGGWPSRPAGLQMLLSDKTAGIVEEHLTRLPWELEGSLVISRETRCNLKKTSVAGIRWHDLLQVQNPKKKNSKRIGDLKPVAILFPLLLPFCWWKGIPAFQKKKPLWVATKEPLLCTFVFYFTFVACVCRKYFWVTLQFCYE